MIAEDFNAVSLFTVDICNVNHRYIHTDITHIFGFLPIDKAVTTAVAEPSVKTICITYRDSGNQTVTLKIGLSAVTDAFTCRKLVYLKDCSL